MSDNKAVITITADDAQVIAKSLAVRKNLGSAGKEAASGFDKMTVSLGKTLLSVTAVVHAIKAVGTALDEVGAKQAGNNKRGGARQTSAETSGKKLGLNHTEVNSIINGSSPRSQDEMVAFLDSLDDAKGPTGKKLNKQDIFKAAAAYGTGAVSQSEVIDAYKKRGSNGLAGIQKEAGSRLDYFSEDVINDLNLRRRENDESRRASSHDFEHGQPRRMADAVRARQEVEHPNAYGISNAAKELSQVGPLIDLINNKILEKQMVQQLQQINANTKPPLNLTGNGP